MRSDDFLDPHGHNHPVAVAFMLIGIAGLAAAIAIGLLGGSESLAWSLGLASVLLTAHAALDLTGVNAWIRGASAAIRWTLVFATAAIAFIGGIGYLVWATDTAWWLAGAASIPAILLLYAWGEEKPAKGGGDLGDVGPLAPP